MPARRLTRVMWMALALWLPLAAHAQPREAESAYEGDEPRLLARLHAEPRGAERWRVGVELVPDPGWHLYGRDPGEVGLPPRIEWQLPGAHFGELEWPARELGAAQFVSDTIGGESLAQNCRRILAIDPEWPGQ